MNHADAEALAFDAFQKGIYAKNIEFGYSKDADPQEFQMIKMMAGSPGQSSWIIQQAHAKLGVQIQVQKEVSDDLLVTDFAPASRLDDVPWPAQVAEIYFEDPKLPSLLVMKATPRDIERWFPGLTVGFREKEYVTALMQEGTGVDAKVLSLQLKPDMYDQFMNESETEAMSDLSYFNKALTAQDNATFAVLMRLVMKVFAFCSISHCRPQPLYRKQMTFGGKANVKGRPDRPSFRCLYLPNVKYTHDETPEERNGTDGKREFTGRRGHFRYFRSERFTNMRNRWTFIKPVADANGNFPKVNVMKVRKPA